MQRDMEHFVASVFECLKRKPLHKSRSNTSCHCIPIWTSVNILHQEICKQGNEYKVVVMDHYTQFVWAYGTKKQVTVTMGNLLQHPQGNGNVDKNTTGLCSHCTELSQVYKQN